MSQDQLPNSDWSVAKWRDDTRTDSDYSIVGTLKVTYDSGSKIISFIRIRAPKSSADVTPIISSASLVLFSGDYITVHELSADDVEGMVRATSSLKDSNATVRKTQLALWEAEDGLKKAKLLAEETKQAAEELAAEEAKQAAEAAEAKRTLAQDEWTKQARDILERMAK